MTLNKIFIIVVIALGLSVVALVNSWPSNDLEELENKLGQQIDSISFSSVGPSINFMSSIAEIYCVDSQDNWYGGSGSIWMNKGNYWIVTNEHVLMDSEECFAYITVDWIATIENPDTAIEDRSLLEYRVDIENREVSSVEGDDLAWALLEEVDQSLKLLRPLAITPDVENCDEFYPIGTNVKIFGYPESGSYNGVITVTEGIISSFEKEGDVYYYLTSAKIDYGNSGGLAFVDINEEIACVIGVPSAVTEGGAESLGRILVLSEGEIKNLLSNN